jgi:hypothetical protein
MNSTISIAKAGLNRFYDEGYVTWPEDKLRVIFGNLSLDVPDVARVLLVWEGNGWIKLAKSRDSYITVLKPIGD